MVNLRRRFLALPSNAYALRLASVALPGLAVAGKAQAQSVPHSGAIASANADGSIPAYTGGLMKPPAGYSPEKGYVDPFAQEKPLFTITAANADQYKDFLSAGSLALLKKQPAFQMPVYKTHRTAGLPDAAKKTVINPSPKTGEEAMANFLNRYAGGGFDREYSWFPVRANGDFYRVGYSDKVVYDENMTPQQTDTGLQFAFLSRYTAPS
ncbi:MAG: DUF1329 domain-containing protein, partial [Burkholderiaceae bacterium]